MIILLVSTFLHNQTGSNPQSTWHCLQKNNIKGKQISAYFAKGKYRFLCSQFKHLSNPLHGLLCLPQSGAHMAAGAGFVHADSTTWAWLHRTRHQQERGVPRQTKAHKHVTKQEWTEINTATEVEHTAPECVTKYRNISV